MKSVLISIHPKWCELIASGKKTIEVRKTCPKIETPFKCYIYCTNGRTIGEIILCKGKENSELFGYNSVVGINKGFAEKEDINLKGKVIGEFVCDDIKTYYADDFVGAEDVDGSIIAEPKDGKFAYWIPEEKETCLPYGEILVYGNGKTLYGWHISDLKIYDKPKELSEFYKTCPDKYHYCETCKHGSIILPPDEEEYALYHGGNYEHYETICHNRVTRPPQSWCYVEEQK